jgi:hypothetical protein
MDLVPLPWWRIAAPVSVFLLLCLVSRFQSRPLLPIIVQCSLALIGYALLQDQISAHLSVEYFTIGHPPIPGIAHPTLLGIAWGFLGGFPGGIVLGVPVALLATVGPFPQLSAQRLRRPILMFLGGVAIATLIAGASGWYNASVVNISIGAPWAQAIAPTAHRAFFIVACAHFGTYLGGAIFGLSLAGWIVWYRIRLDRGRRQT